MQIALVGYRGTGKSTVARRLAERLQCGWLDLDVELERRAGRTIAEIFADEGEAAFRDLEAAVLADALTRPEQVLATGGGVVLREENRARLVPPLKVVWLRARPETILARLAADPTTGARRPNLTTAGGRAEVEDLLARRTPLYEAVAELIVDTDDAPPDALAERILLGLAIVPRGEMQ